MNTCDTYLHLLRSALGVAFGSESSEFRVEGLGLSGEKLASLLRLCQIQGTGPLVYEQLLSLNPQPSPLNPTLQMHLKQQCMQNMLLQSRWKYVIRQVWEALRGYEGLREVMNSSNGDASVNEGENRLKSVNAVLLKGFGLAQLYSKPYLRQWGDLDVWVGTEFYHEACERLRAAFPDAEHNEEEDEDFKHYCLVLSDGMLIEVHRVSMTFANSRDMEYYHRLEIEGMQGGPTFKVGNIDVQCPKDDFNLLFVFLHAWEHFSTSGMSMKLICDMALLAHYTYGIESESVRKHIEDYLRPALKRLHVWEVWQMVGYVVIHTLALPETEWPLYDELGLKFMVDGFKAEDRCLGLRVEGLVVRGEKLMKRILEEGQGRKHEIAFGAKTPEEAAEIARQLPILKRKWLTLQNRLASYRFMRDYAPEYARHELFANLIKGVDRTIHNKSMAKYF